MTLCTVELRFAACCHVISIGNRFFNSAISQSMIYLSIVTMTPVQSL